MSNEAIDTMTADEFNALGRVPGGREVQMHYVAQLDDEGNRRLEAELSASGRSGSARAIVRAQADLFLMRRGPTHTGHLDLIEHFLGERRHMTSDQHTYGLAAVKDDPALVAAHYRAVAALAKRPRIEVPS